MSDIWPAYVRLFADSADPQHDGQLQRESVPKVNDG
jgi:hypothetical protein